MRHRSVSAEDLDYYRAHFLEALREDGVVCLECGALLRFLGRHVGHHGLTADQYREKWGYNRGTALLIPALHEAKRQYALAHNLVARLPSAEEILPKAHEVRRRLTIPTRLESRLTYAASKRASFAAGARPSNLRVDPAALRALVEAGLTSRAIAARTGLRHDWCRKRLRRLGLVPPDFAPLELTEPYATVLALRRDGLWPSQIAARTGMTVKDVNGCLRSLRQRGVALPRPTGPRPNRLRRISDEQLLALVAAGLRHAPIAARLGVALRSVEGRLQALRRRGLLPAAPRPVSDEQLLTLAQAGFRNYQIAARVGISPSGVGHRLRTLRQRGLLPPTAPSVLDAGAGERA